MVTAFVDMLGLIIVYPLLPFYATRLGANAAMVGALVAAFSVAQLLSAPAWGWMSDRYGRRPAILVGLIFSAFAYVIFAFAGSIWLLFLSRIIQGLGGGTIGVVQAYVADITEGKDRAKARNQRAREARLRSAPAAPPDTLPRQSRLQQTERSS